MERKLARLTGAGIDWSQSVEEKRAAGLLTWIRRLLQAVEIQDAVTA
jgi:hypothetical protein